MANKRMFSLDIVDTDKFLDMPMSAQALYFHLGMRADDEGFIASPRRVVFAVGSCPDDLSLLVLKGYLIQFGSGVYVLRHWKQHNYIPKDRFHPTKCTEEKALLSLDNGSVYGLLPPAACDVVDNAHTTCIQDCIQPVDNLSTQIRLDKIRLDKTSIPPYPPEGGAPAAQGEKRKRFVPPSVEDVAAYCRERGNGIDPNSFVDFYQSKGWVVGKSPMKDWRAAVRQWEAKRKAEHHSAGAPAPDINDPSAYSWED